MLRCVQMCLSGQAFAQCTACSAAVVQQYKEQGHAFLLKVRFLGYSNPLENQRRPLLEDKSSQAPRQCLLFLTCLTSLGQVLALCSRMCAC